MLSLSTGLSVGRCRQVGGSKVFEELADARARIGELEAEAEALARALARRSAESEATARRLAVTEIRAAELEWLAAEGERGAVRAAAAEQEAAALRGAMGALVVARMAEAGRRLELGASGLAGFPPEQDLD